MSFDKIFRSSKFATIQPGQVLYSPKSLRSHGEYGIKHALPPVAPRNLQVLKMDDSLIGKPTFKSAQSSLSQLELWKSIAPMYEEPKARQIAVQSLEKKKSLEDMNETEWLQTLKSTRERREEFQSLVKQGKILSDQTESFLGITDSCSFEKEIPVHPPTYYIHDREDAKPITVQGRILNPVKGGFAVGVSGIVAFLPQSEASLEKLSKYQIYKKKESSSKHGMTRFGSIDRDILIPFYVLGAQWDEQGRPELILSNNPPSGKANKEKWKSGQVDTKKVSSILDLLSNINIQDKPK